MPYLGVVRGKCEGYSNYSVIIRNNQNLQYYFQQKVFTKKGKILIDSNPSLCMDELVDELQNKEYWKKMELRNNTCDIPIVNFIVLTSYDSALIQIEELTNGIEYQFWYHEKENVESMKTLKLSKETFEINDLSSKSTYVAFISSKKENFNFNSSKKEFRVKQHVKFVKIINDRDDTETNSIALQWRDLNEISRDENVFYYIHIANEQKAKESDRMIKGKCKNINC